MPQPIKITVLLSLLFFLADCKANSNINYQMTEADGQIVQDIYKLCQIEYPPDMNRYGDATDCFIHIRDLAHIESENLKMRYLQFAHPPELDIPNVVLDYADPNIPCSEFDNYPIPYKTLDFSEGRPSLAKEIHRLETYEEFEKNIKRNKQCGYKTCSPRNSNLCQYKKVELEMKLGNYRDKLNKTNFPVNEPPVKGCEPEAAILNNILDKNIQEYLHRQIKEYKDCLIRHKQRI